MIEAGDIATWAAAGVAVVSAGVAWRQTREARKSRVAAEKQADEAAKSRIAAEAQARAAEEQVALMRAERDVRDAPAFSVSAVDAHPDDTGYFAAKIVLTLEQGRALSSVAVTASGEYVGGLHLPTNTIDGSGASAELTFDDVRPGREITFYAGANDGYVGTPIDIDVTCHERDGNRTWPCHYTCTIARRPQPSRTRMTMGC